MLLSQIKSCDTLQDIQRLLVQQGMQRDDASLVLDFIVKFTVQEQQELTALISKYH